MTEPEAIGQGGQAAAAYADRRVPAAPRPVRRGGHTRTARAFAAIDLGTNNCRMLVGAPEAGGFRVLDSYSRATRLGEGLQQEGRLAQPAMQRTLEALQTCATRLGRMELRGVRAVATEACRQAANGDDFLAIARAATGLPIRMISPREEAELAVESCAALLATRDGRDSRAILFDIGGGSTEIAWLRIPGARRPAGVGAETGAQAPAPPEVIGSISIPFGVVTVADAFGGVLTPAAYHRIADQVMGALADFERTHCIRREIQRGPVRMIGTSGTITTLASVSLGLPRYQRERVDGLELGLDMAHAVTGYLRGLGEAGLRGHRCIGSGRALYVLPGCAIFDAICQLWPTARVTVADRGLRDGMLLRMMREDAARPAAAAHRRNVIHSRG